MKMPRTSSINLSTRTPSTNRSGRQTHCCSAPLLTPAAVNLKLLHGFPLKLNRVEPGLGGLLSKTKIAGGGGAPSVYTSLIRVLLWLVDDVCCNFHHQNSPQMSMHAVHVKAVFFFVSVQTCAQTTSRVSDFSA